MCPWELVVRIEETHRYYEKGNGEMKGKEI
jgi:hypothetical protein